MTIVHRDFLRLSSCTPIYFLVLWIAGPFVFAADSDIDFTTEIIPILTKSGCNGGACHGAAAGRGGFRLSLLGSNPAADFDAIVHENEGRRINLHRAPSSLLLRKPSGALDHGGDVALDSSSLGYRKLIAWIASGAKSGNSPHLKELLVSPKQQIATADDRVNITVHARFESGELRNVTAWAQVNSGDPSAVEIHESSNGIAAFAKRSGQHLVVVRYLDQVVPVQINVPFPNERFTFNRSPTSNYVDDSIERVLEQMHIPPSGRATTHQWLRRVTLDLTGCLPDLDAINRFSVQNADRAQYVDQLLGSIEFVDFWTLRFSKLLRMRSLPNDSECVATYGDWLKDRIAQRTGIDRIATELITATGDSHLFGASNFSRMVSDAREQAEHFGQLFLGVQIGCANCHNHPLDRWTQDDYHGLAAIFAKLERGREVKIGRRGAVTNPRNNEPAIPRIPGDRDLTGEDDHRMALSEWLTQRDNPYFARAMVNRLWKLMMGRGLVEPVEDLRSTNMATHPELLERLCQDFVENNYEIRSILKRISLSDAYARSSTPTKQNKLDDRFYSHAYSRPLMPEVLMDAIVDVTGVPTSYPSSEARRAIQLIDSLQTEPGLEALGRCSRNKMCDNSTSGSSSLESQLHRMNGKLLNEKIQSTSGRLAQLIRAGKSDAEIVQEFYLRALGREPSNPEAAYWSRALTGTISNDVVTQVERSQRLQDFLWSLLSSRAFLENQ